ncbi:acylpyruvate hydrolase [Raineyella antarctica]|uniref:Acylpyruvate hydrolase n=1 Tax=Raineyella antarctica TaxID=1577474 RepID=A0A1G6GDP5_9ACTN|nr:fumarylacetoacetate hydrolase family protein [Raineyella antarctica]SDB80094.1 acylpyruvate hydrolase [Raineyella antarctica]
MKLATIRTTEGTKAVRVEGDTFVDLGVDSVSTLLASEDWEARAAADGPTLSAADADFAPVTPEPKKIICVGLNYRTHIKEMGRDLPEYPTLFAKYPEALIGANDDIILPPEDDQYDWEAELAIVIGKKVRRAKGAEAEAAIAGYSTLNDVTMRGWQYRSKMWLQGKTWANTTPMGPYLVTKDEVGGGRPALKIEDALNGETKQSDTTGDLVFDPITLVEYISTILTLEPGDVIATGTTGGVGHARKPSQYMKAGDVLVTEIEGLGRCENRCVAEVVE